MKISVVGAPGTGRSQLSADLNVSLRTASLNAVVTVSHVDVLADADLIFLMGLETVLGATVEADQSIRAALIQTGLAHDVLYGSPEDRFFRAFKTIKKRLAITTFEKASPENTSGDAKRWIWECEKCSDPHCEHRLLTDLLKNRLPTQATGP